MNDLVCHLVADYPTTQDSLALMKGLHDLDVSAMELQIPFSDPIADGETIMTANDKALQNGATTASSFELIKRARKQEVTTDIYIMSYVQKLHNFGIAAFCAQAEECHAKGLILPDLPFDSHEFAEISQIAAAHTLQIIPVLSPGMNQDRLSVLLKSQPEVIYITSIRGITGNTFKSSQQLRELVAQVQAKTQARIMIGFGISRKDDVKQALEMGDAAIIGSALIRAIEAGGVPAGLAFVRSLQ